MKKGYFVGIDTGTFESKGVITDHEFNIIASHAVAHGMENPKPNYFEHDADAVWWHDFCKISNADLKKGKIKVIHIDITKVELLLVENILLCQTEKENNYQQQEKQKKS